MAQELLDLEVDEVSLVDEPANKGARVVLWKRDDRGHEKGRATMERTERVSLVTRTLKALGLTKADLNDEGEGGPEVDEKTRKRIDDLAAEVEKLKETAGADAVAKAVREARASDEPDVAKLEAEVASLRKDADIADLRKRLEDVEKRGESDAAFAEFRKNLPKAMQKPFDEMTDEEKRRFMDSRKADASDPVAKALEDVTKEKDKLEARLEKLEADRDLAKVREELAGVENIGDVGDLAKTVRDLRKTDRDAADRLVERLKAASERAKAAGLFEEAGKRGKPDADSAAAEIDKRAEKLREQDPKLTKSAARSQVLKADPELYDRHRAEKRGH